MRLFTGLSLPFEVRRNLELLLQHLQPLAEIHWSPVDNLHVTTKFIGDWPEERLPELKDRLNAMPKPAPFRLSISGMGWFPNPHHPRVFFAGVQAPPELFELAKATDGAVPMEAEKKDYHPHLTLARIKTNADLAPLRRAIAGLPSTDFGFVDVKKFNLYRSEAGPNASRYSVLAEFAL
jgi:2'-5' RNA ligase